MFIELMCIDAILRQWRKNPETPKKAYRLVSRWQDGRAADDKPLTSAEVAKYKALLKRHAPSSYYNIFPEELD